MIGVEGSDTLGALILLAVVALIAPWVWGWRWRSRARSATRLVDSALRPADWIGYDPYDPDAVADAVAGLSKSDAPTFYPWVCSPITPLMLSEWGIDVGPDHPLWAWLSASAPSAQVVEHRYLRG